MAEHKHNLARIGTAGGALAVLALALLLAVMAAPAAAEVPDAHENIIIESENSSVLLEAEIDDSVLDADSEATVFLAYGDDTEQSYEGRHSIDINDTDFDGANTTWVSHTFDNASAGNWTAFATVSTNDSTAEGVVEKFQTTIDPGSQGPITGLFEDASDTQILAGVVVLVGAILVARKMGEQ